MHQSFNFNESHALQAQTLDIELEWNAVVDQSMGKITQDHVKDIPTTTELLCSPGKYTDADYKLDSIYKNFG